MKVKLKKDHLSFKKKEIVEVSNDKARYWIACGVAEEVKNDKKKNTKKAPVTKKGAIEKK